MAQFLERRRNRQAVRSVLAFSLSVFVFIYSIAGGYTASAQDSPGDQPESSSAPAADRPVTESNSLPTASSTSIAPPAPQTQEAPSHSSSASSTQPAASQSSASEPSAQPTAAVVPAQSPTIVEKKVIAVEIIGNQIISTQTIISKMRIRKGAILRQQTVNDDIKRLYAAGYFDDIQVKLDELPDGFKIYVTVVEKPVIKEIQISGHTIYKDEKIRKTLGLVEGEVIDENKLNKGIEEIRKLYEKKGFRFIEIKRDVQKDMNAGQATIKIQIEEGKKYKIGRVVFEGNKSFKSKELSKLMKNKPRKWFLFGTFKEDEFDQDLERIYFQYQKEGFIDVKVAPEFAYDDKKHDMTVKILIEEGQKYLTGEVKFKGNQLFPESELWQELEMLPGLTYSQYYIAQDVEKLRSFYNERGYMDARIIPDIQLNKESGKVDVQYEIVEGDLYFVDKVVIRGNSKTRDQVIRRELRIRPGDRFDGDKIKKSKERLDNLNYFEDVTYDTVPSETEPNRKDLVFRVKEKRTGELSFGGGVSSVDRFLGFAEISQKNFDLFNWPRFTGGGQSISLRARVGTISRNFAFSFVEPYLFGRPYAFGFDVYNNFRDNTNVDFDETRFGAGVTISRLIKDLFRVGGGYTMEQVKLKNLSDDAPQTVRDYEGSTLLSRFKTFSTYDSRDNYFAPTKGSQAGINAELIGTFIGGDADYYILNTNYTKFFQIWKKHLIEAGARLGISDSLSDTNEVPVFDRFYAGGLGSVRGFNYRRVSPIENGNAVGGQSMAIFNVDYTFPVPFLDIMRGVVFVDAGNVNRGTFKFNFSDFSTSVGPGVKIKTPLGPIALYYGYPIFNKDTENENGRFEFSLSRGF